jgi:hypothetical protein
MPGILQQSGYVLRGPSRCLMGFVIQEVYKSVFTFGIHLLDVIGECWDKFSVFIKDSPTALL